ncbi:cell division suppressor protein YneA [Alkalicoccus luteus]|uniref:LysM peptidoglycan-binding domain-containing protein n=1 Tax=Alkalicoccus luteus TaxID=1237094 RepID=A0A969PPY6_9BACI|nr:LysM peptidoglycan-binding domain-containing protein [Alkalicoccus luteus]NJP36271.1 LysM peptidoglycan-binding domain-containing protein [Alkalicoccus luteus]
MIRQWNITGPVTSLLAAAAIFTAAGASGGEHPHTPADGEHIVQEGESLWTVADSVSGELDMKLEETVYWLKQENELDSETIYPGQSLTVPGKWIGVASD